MSKIYGKQFNWAGENFEHALGRWTNDRSLLAFKSLLAIVCWGIWIHRNCSIFKDKVMTPHLIAANFVAIANHFVVIQKPPRIRLLVQEVIDKSYPWGYFDGVAQGDPIVCGVGALLYLDDRHLFQIRWGLGEGTNNKVELLALYMLLIFTNENGVQRIQIFGDSMVIINWINQTQRCHNIHLNPILEEATQLKTTFNQISFTHIFREQNKEADKCSKEAARPLLLAWEIEEWGPNEAYGFYHRPFFENHFLDADQP